ncbi:MAG TPA: hypothetical protein VFR72_06285 [Gemmatimonadales bacterium]|nr:hypothetical protein [Gemmatimonadales bacterium]
MGPFETVALVAVLFAGVKIFGPVGAAIADRLRGSRRQGEQDPLLAEEVDVLRDRVGQLEEMQRRMLELEERVDFAERLLAQPERPARVGAPAEGDGR